MKGCTHIFKPQDPFWGEVKCERCDAHGMRFKYDGQDYAIIADSISECTSLYNEFMKEKAEKKKVEEKERLELVKRLSPKEKLLRELEKCKDHDAEAGHMMADSLLLDYIGDPDIKKKFLSLTRWYS